MFSTKSFFNQFKEVEYESKRKNLYQGYSNYIILGAFSALTGALSMAGSSMMGSVANDPAVQDALAQAGSSVSTDELARMAMISGGMLLGMGILYLVVGILGVIFAKNTGKAKLLMVLGGIVAVLAIVSTVINIINGASMSGVFMDLAFIVLAGLYFLGAKLNNDDAKAEMAAAQAIETVEVEIIEDDQDEEK